MRWEEAKLERLTTHQDCGAGLRYLLGEENRYASVDNPVPSDIAGLARQLWPGNSTSNKKAIPSPAAPSIYKPVIRLAPRDVPPAKKVSLIERCHQAASLAHVRQISISYGEVDKHIRIWTSEGKSTEEWRTTLTFSISVVAEKDGVLQTAYDAVSGNAGFEYFEKVDVVALSKKVAERAVRRLSSPAAPLGEMPIIIAVKPEGR